MRKHFYITQHYQKTKMSQSNKIQTISTLFPQELWGDVKLDTPEERAAHFNKLWCEWKDTEIELPRGDTTMVATRYEYLDAKHIKFLDNALVMEGIIADEKNVYGRCLIEFKNG